MRDFSKYLLALLTFAVSLPLFGQDFVPYQWQAERKLTELSQEESAIPLLYLSIDKRLQYVYEGPNNDLACYLTEHHIIRAGNHEALENINRIYISTDDMLDLVDVKARTITPAGKIIQLDENNIKEVKDEEEGGGYKIFAIEGAEVGGEVEYYFTKKISPRYFGREFMQLKYPIRSVSFFLSCPENLEFDFRSYNGMEKVVQTDTTETLNVYELVARDVKSLPQEAFSSFDASRQRIDFKLAYNSASGNRRLFTWDDAAGRIYNQIYNFSSYEQKEIKKLIKSLEVTKMADEKERVSMLEHYIKTNFYLDENAGEAGDLVGNILSQKYGSEKGLTALFAAVFSELGIQHQLVLTQSRSIVKFDKDFDTWSSLDDYLIYLPDLDLYLTPYDHSLRLGTVPAELTATYGLFIKPTIVRDFIYPIADIQWIPAPDYRHDFDNLGIQLNFSDDISTSEVKVSRSFQGYQSSYLKAAYLFLENEKKNEMLKGLIEFLSPDAEIADVSLTNKEINYSNWNDPFIINATYTTPSYMEVAGDILLFKVGELIGPQTELYQDDERHTGVENQFNRGYLREIKVKIPEGYTIENPDDINMDVKVSEEERIIYIFKSKYSLTDDLLSIQIDEYYDEIYFPHDRFEEFRKVVNAAADWNKVTLVMKK